MTLTDDRAIARIATGIIDRTLPREEWTHAAHFAAALWLSRERPELTSPDAFRAIIRGYNAAVGTANSATSGYHHTITLASLRAAGAHLREHAADTPCHEVLAGLMASPLGRSDWLLTHWHRETLFAPAARRDWVEPDREALPF